MAGKEFEVKIEGLKELDKLLADASDRIEKKIIKRRVNELTEKIRQIVAARAPTGTKPHRGRLKNLPKLRVSFEPGSIRDRKGYITNVLLGNFYAYFLERGTKKMRAHEFIEPAIEEATAQLLPEFIDQLTKDLIKELNGN